MCTVLLIKCFYDVRSIIEPTAVHLLSESTLLRWLHQRQHTDYDHVLPQIGPKYNWTKFSNRISSMRRNWTKIQSALTFLLFNFIKKSLKPGRNFGWNVHFRIVLSSFFQFWNFAETPRKIQKIFFLKFGFSTSGPRGVLKNHQKTEKKTAIDVSRWVHVV